MDDKNPQANINQDPSQLGYVIAHDHDGVNSLPIKLERFVQYRALAPATANTVAVVGGSFVAPFNGTITLVGATVDTAGTTGSETIDILKNGTSIMTNTKINIGSTSTTSRATAIQPVLTTMGFNLGDIFTFSVTAIQTTPALGLTVFMTVFKSIT